MRRKIHTREEWFQKFKDLNDKTFQTIKNEISSLPYEVQGRVWVFVTTLLNDSIPPQGTRLTHVESFRLAFPQCSISENATPESLQRTFNRQKKIHNDLLKIAFSPNVSQPLRMDLLSILRNHFPLGSLWSFTENMKMPRGRQSRLARNLSIVGLVNLFRQYGSTKDEALEKVSSILLTTGEKLSFDGIESAYKSGKRLVKKSSKTPR